MRFQALSLLVGLYGCCLPGPDPASTGRAESTAETPTPGPWTVEEDRSKLDDSPTVRLISPSVDKVTTWTGRKESSALVLRCQENTTSAIVVTNTGAQPELGRYRQATVQVRFDRGAARTLVADESTTNKALFLPRPIPLIREMTQHETMLVRFTPVNGSPQDVRFRLDGLAAHLPKLQAACGWDQSSARGSHSGGR